MGLFIGGGSNVIYTQGFESSPAAGWAYSGTGTVDDSYATNPPVGSKCLRFSLSAQTGIATYTIGQSLDSALLKWRGRLESPSISGSPTIFRWQTGVSTVIGSIISVSDGKMRATATGGTLNNSTGTVSIDIDYYWWFLAVKGTGANCQCGVAWNTVDSMPSIVASGSNSALSTDGTGTGPVDKFNFGSSSSVTLGLIVDDLVLTL